MFPCTVRELSRIVGSACEPTCDQVINGVSIDSRSINAGEVFFGLSGARRHGMAFADDALRNGAGCVVSDRCMWSADGTPVSAASLIPVDGFDTQERILLVSDAVVALQSLAAWNRRQSGALILGITGSVGKTTTRQMIHAVLGGCFAGVQSPHNFNNELGLPLSLLQLNVEHEFAVVEMGATRQGDIEKLAAIADPEIAVVTRVCPAHLESFGSLENIAAAKTELPAAVSKTGLVFLNADDPLVRAMSSSVSAPVLFFGWSDDADFRITRVESRNGLTEIKVAGDCYRFEGPRHLISNAAAAIAVGRTIGIPLSDIRESLRQFQPDTGRGRVVQRHPWTVIDDTYNSSPASLEGAITSLRDWDQARHRIVVLGDMLELGEHAESAHREMGRMLMSSAADHALIVGKHSETVAAGAREVRGSLNRISVFHDISTMLSMLDCLVAPGDVVLVKGSRKLRLEQVVSALSQAGPDESRRVA